MKQQFDLIVVGAGMVGASAALAFAQLGWRVAILERGELNRELPSGDDDIDLRVSALSPASRQLLHELGVWQMIPETRRCDYQRMRVWHEHGSVQMNFAAEQVAAPALGTIVENRTVQAALLQRLDTLTNVTLSGHTGVDQLCQTSDFVEVRDTSGNLWRASLMLAADGRESSVRELLRLPLWQGDYHQGAIVANVSLQHPHQATAWQRFLGTGPLAFLPLWDGRCSIVWSADRGRAAELMAQDDAEFALELEQALESRLGRVEAVSKRVMIPLRWHQATQWLDRRSLLIGDAAHAVHPLAGQGVNLGFGDVTTLAGLLRQDAESLYQPRRLRQFERQRKAETSLATHLFSGLKLIYGSNSAELGWLRDAGMAVVERNPLVKRLVMRSAVRNMA
jgi:2-octaprenylphenol hydroxylase